MIRPQDIRDRAGEWQLRADIVEKDYVLGWLLAALAAHPVTSSSWIFKGGTCIKKCYVETYRFSEDLDFSLLPESPYTEESLRDILRQLARSCGDLTGIDFPPDLVTVRPRNDRLGRPTFEARLAYRGPLGIPTYPRVIFDITQHEPVLDAPSPRPVFHPYPDALPEDVHVPTYSLDELLAEKTRALYERTRPRDLYDIVYLLENMPEAFDLSHSRELLARKCAAKRLEVPSSARLLEIARDAEELRSEWANMLGHQLPVLPSLDDLLGRLPDLLRWVDEPAAVLPEMRLASAPVSAREIVFAPAGIQYWGGGAALEAIRFAGANRLLLEFTYNGTRRRVEPYSLRRAETTGNLLLYAWEQGSAHIKAFNTANMSDIRSTNISFQPRYRVELTSHGPISAPVAAAPIRRSFSTAPRQTRRASQTRSSYGPTYVFQCPHCQKEFRHSKNDSALRKHKAPYGYGNCPGRKGYLLRIE